MEHFQSAGCLSHFHVTYSRLSSAQEANLSSILLHNKTTPLNDDAPPVHDKTGPTCSHNQVPPLLDSKAPYPKYVQDQIRLHWKELGSWLVEDKSYVYVCG